jgi:hypothetical protein
MKKEKVNLCYISLEDWKEGDKLYQEWDDEEGSEKPDENEIILKKNKEYTLFIRYPLSNPYKKVFKTSIKGMSRKELVKLIVDAYHEIYDTEESTSKIMPDLIPGMYNRNTTEGKYGIWGHDLGDLMLGGVYIGKNNVIEPSVDS